MSNRGYKKLCKTLVKYKKKSIKKDFIYHHTNIEALKKIIESKAIRLSRNDHVNDLIEHEKTMHLENFNYFVTCFTHEKKESIPLWYMYAKNEVNHKTGIRMKIKNDNILKGNPYILNSHDEKVYFETEKQQSGKVIENSISTEKGFITLGKTDSIMVIYNDDPLKNYPYEVNEMIAVTKVDAMVGIKGTPWNFEKEIRYFVPVANNKINIEYIYYELDEQFFSDLEIIFTPFINEDEKQNYIDCINILTASNGIGNLKFSDSELKDKIRIL